ncbi:MAG: NAD-glutamate dehydrogenase, partial [Rhizobiales bacterium]|nr:NAD-glutamate dehydrogenase [Hyphomicrobiales bacterium]
MTGAGLLSGAEERAGRTLTQQAGVILSGRRGDLPRDFPSELFGGASMEDVVRYDAQALAALSEAAWDFLQQRPPGVPKLRLRREPAADGGIAVLQIVNDDMPFLLDSVMGELTERGIDVRLVAHPIFRLERDAGGRLVGFSGTTGANGRGARESFIELHLGAVGDDAQAAATLSAIEQVLGEVRVCVQDWRAMLARVEAAVADLRDGAARLPPDEVGEAVAFLEWLLANNFTLLGLRDYTLSGDEHEPVFESGLGILRERNVRVLMRGGAPVTLTPEIRSFLAEPKALMIVKANVRSRVHRRVYMDFVGLKRFDAEGRLVGEMRIVGLFTSTAYTRSARSIPYIRRKIDAVLRRAGFDENSHSGKALVNVLEAYPRDDLFQIDEDTLFSFALAIMRLDERPRVRVLPRRDRFDRFVSVLVFLPRDRYGSGARLAIGNMLADAYAGRVSAFYPVFLEGPLVRVHYIIGRSGGDAPDPQRADLEDAVSRIVRTWADDLEDALVLAHGAEQGGALLRRYQGAFSGAYRESFPAAAAVSDIRIVEGLTAERPVALDFYDRDDEGPSRAGLKVWSAGRPIPLSERVPVLENMGFKVVDERTYEVAPEGSGTQGVWFHDMLLERADGQEFDPGGLAPRLEACCLAVISGEAENDGFNALVLTAGLPWRDVALLRTIARFLRQARIAYSQDYLWTTLRKHTGVAAQLSALFNLKFDPRLDASADERKALMERLAETIEAALTDVESLDEDVILRRFVNAVNAAVRTNYFQMLDDGGAPPTISIKFESRRLDELPPPKPLYEIFVYSPRVEGVHLRFGKVARGGIRWSDRPQDFRTEVLGLVKAQQVKNAVIVPVGSKGG